MHQENNIQEIPLKDLTVSPLNVRKTSSDKEIAELAQSIQSKGLIQNLTAFASKGEKKYEVVAGGRRLQALQLLAKNKVIDPNVYTVRVNLIEKSNATEISLTENAMRADLHPVDQFGAFKKLVDDGTSIEDVAASFSVTPAVVNRRLRMASAAPEVLEAFKAGDIDLDRVMAFCTTDDHKVQKSFLKKSYWSAHGIRHEINKLVNGIDSDDRLVKFIGLDAYKASGGQVIEDLFASEFDDGSGVTLTDSELVNRLAQEKLQEIASADQLRQKFGWSRIFLDRQHFIWSEQKVESFTGKPTNDDKKFLGIIYYIDYNGKPQCEKNLINYGDRKKFSAKKVAQTKSLRPDRLRF